MPSDDKPPTGRASSDHRITDWINDILTNVASITAFLAGATRESFLGNLEKIYAVQFALVAISEAARRLPEEIKQRHPAIAWPQIQALRNFYTHEYHRINPNRVWTTATVDLPALARAMRSELDRLTRKA